MKRRAFISMLAGGAGALILPKWRVPDPVIILPAVEEEFNLYGFGLAPVKSEGGIILYDNFAKALAPGLLKVWQDHYNDPEFEDLFK